MSNENQCNNWLKCAWTILKRPSSKYSLGLILLVGIIAGILFWGGFHTAMEMSNTETVFIIWVMEGRFPPARAYNNPLALEEERRLMYVAATRAKDRLIMCYPGRESMPSWSAYSGAGAGYRNGLSSFLQGLPEGVISYESGGIARTMPDIGWQRSRAVSPEKTKAGSAGFTPGILEACPSDLGLI